MNQSRFQRWMHAVDDELLEEAHRPHKKQSRWLRLGVSAAACICLVTAGMLLWHHGSSGGTQIANPIESASAEQLEQLGYSIPLPEGAESPAYALIKTGEDGATPMAQATFLKGGQTYTCRALKTQQAEDISGIYTDWSQSLDWSVGTLELQLRQSSDSAWVGWFSPEDETQWCLSGEDGDGLGLLHTAQSIVETLGYDLAVAPEGAEHVVYNAFLLDGLTVGETTFDWNGVHCAYRMASTSEVSEDFADISGTEESYEKTAVAQVQWCPAKLFYNEGGSGKILWFDVVPGLLYSVSVDSGATESSLLELAGQLFTPAQGDVG